MSATVIAFPAPRQKRASRRGQYDFLTAESALRWHAERPASFREALVEFAADRARASLTSQPPTQPAAEDEILKLLRRIDRRLAKIGAGQTEPTNQQCLQDLN